jgi:hypothetical protein
MSARLTLIAAVALTIGTLTSHTAALAEPARTQDHVSQPANRPAAIVLASAETAQAQAQAPAGDQPAAPAAKPRRAARVTTCRCGDPQPEPQDQQ